MTGIVEVIRAERDGDLHLLVRLDPGQDKYVNAKNLSAERGDLVVEPVCVRAVTQLDAVAACNGYVNPLAIPAIGTHVAITGAWVLDIDHGWMEIHPVASFNAVGSAPTTAPIGAPTAVAPTSAPTAVPTAPPTAAAFAVRITAASYGYLAAVTSPGAVCSARARLPSGSYSQAHGLQVQPTADGGGNVSWSYGTTSRTTAGTGTYFVTCSLGGQSVSTQGNFTVT